MPTGMPALHLAAGADDATRVGALIDVLHERNVAVYLVSGGVKEMSNQILFVYAFCTVVTIWFPRMVVQTMQEMRPFPQQEPQQALV